MDDTPQGQGASPPSGPDAPPPTSPRPGAVPEGKECILCGEGIATFADRCAHCGGYLPIAEGRAFGHHFFFLVCCMAIFIGTMLPWEGMWWDSYGWRSIHGGFLLLLAGYGMVAAFFNIFHRRMIVWPVILAALDGTYTGWRRLIQLASSDVAQKIDWNGDLFQKKKAFIEFSRLFGPGLLLVVLFASIFWLVFVWSVIRGGVAAGARKEAEKAARAARRAEK
jgi:hypothetical protein